MEMRSTKIIRIHLRNRTECQNPSQRPKKCGFLCNTYVSWGKSSL